MLLACSQEELSMNRQLTTEIPSHFRQCLKENPRRREGGRIRNVWRNERNLLTWKEEKEGERNDKMGKKNGLQSNKEDKKK
jgi:hypothetical protein